MDNYYREFMRTIIRENDDKEESNDLFKDCLMAEISSESGYDDSVDVDIKTKILSFIEKIPDDILYTEESDHGKEKWPHVTVLYGLKSGLMEECEKILSEYEGKDVSLKLGKVSKFKNDKFDVLKIEVISEDLKELNSKVSKLPNKNSYPDYKPHVTLAYVLPGEGNEFDGSDEFDGDELLIKKFVYSNHEREHDNILLEYSIGNYSIGGAGYGGFSGGPVGLGFMGNYGRNQNLDNFSKSSKFIKRDDDDSPVGGTEGSRSLPQRGNTVISWSPYDSIKPSDVDVPGIDKDELFQGIRTEMERQLRPDKNSAKNQAIENLKKDSKYYSGLKMYNEEQFATEISKILTDMKSKNDGQSSAYSNPVNEMIQAEIKKRTSGRSIESISKIIRDMSGE